MYTFANWMSINGITLYTYVYGLKPMWGVILRQWSINMNDSVDNESYSGVSWE